MTCDSDLDHENSIDTRGNPCSHIIGEADDARGLNEEKRNSPPPGAPLSGLTQGYRWSHRRTEQVPLVGGAFTVRNELRGGADKVGPIGNSLRALALRSP